MIRLAIAIMALLAGVASAAPVMVKSGEHDGFTRLVMEYGSLVDWKVGRTEDGYELRTADRTPSYDLTEAFKLIGKSRLAGIWADPDKGSLHFGVACTCYAIPFEFRPGIVVIDLRDGAPPKGSSFELSLDEPTTPLPMEDVTDSGQNYDWKRTALSKLRGEMPMEVEKSPFAPMPSSDPALQTLRDSLLHQMSRGAAQGVVDMTIHQPIDNSKVSVPGDAFVQARIGLGEMPGVAIIVDPSEKDDLGAQGQSCLSNETLDLQSWGDSTTISEQMVNANAGLIGEFDKPDPEALKKAIQFRLYIGFGAEAVQLIRAFPIGLPDAPVWQSIALLLDDRPDPQSAFTGQEACDSSAALWAILANETLGKATVINADAAFLAFSALPIALRRSLGPTLAGRFIAAGDMDAAKKVRDAILRAPGGSGPEVSLMEAKINITDGNPADAEVELHRILANSGPATSATIVALVEARIAQDLPIAPDMVTALEAVVQEQTGTAEQPVARRALVLAKAASGDFGGAFSMLATAPDAEPKLWRILSLLGTDDAILAHGVLAIETNPLFVDEETRSKLAERLLALGMAESALQWVSDATKAKPMLLARIQLQRHDSRSALLALTGQETDDALKLRAESLQQLGDEAGAARVYAEVGDRESELRALGRARSWADIGARGGNPWKQVADLIVSNSVDPDVATKGTLAKGQDLVIESAATRAAVDALLAQVAMP